MRIHCEVLVVFLSFFVLGTTLKAEKEIDLEEAKQGPGQIVNIKNSNSYYYERPKFLEVITNTPNTYKELFFDIFKKESVPAIVAVTISTALTYYYDEDILRGVQRFGRNVGIGNDDNTKKMIGIGEMPIFRGPTDLGSSLYFLGDGWFHGGITASFYIYGAVAKNNRAMQTGAQMAHGLLVGTLACQTAKRLTGRESPFRSMEYRGKWQWFPNQNKYNNDTSKYDAFYSGHLTTSMMIYTVMTKNYPEYFFIKPLGITLMTLLSLQMINNGVHWASDYPLAIGMGDLFGRISVRNGRKIVKEQKVASSQKNFLDSLNIIPFYSPNRMMGIHLSYSF